MMFVLGLLVGVAIMLICILGFILYAMNNFNPFR